MSQWIVRGIGWVVALVIGALYGAAGTIAHAAIPPYGILLAAVGCLAILVALRCLADDRIVPIAGGLGMYLALLVLSQRGPGGSVIVPNTPLAQIWAITVGAIVLLVVAWPDMRKLRQQAAPEAATAAGPEATPAVPAIASEPTLAAPEEAPDGVTRVD